MTHWKLMAAALPLAIVAAGPALAQEAPTRERAQHLHDNPAAYAASLDDPARDAWQKPADVVAALGLKAGDAVADIGSGSGYFTLRFAQAVGATGVVYGVDISPDMTRLLTRRARDQKLPQVRPILAAPDDPVLPPASLDLVFICDTWHHVEERVKYLGLLRQALKPGGRIVNVDFHKRDLPVGPPVSMKLARDEVVAEFAKAGFTLMKEETFLPHQYFLVFQ